jgi:hypothetical protein
MAGVHRLEERRAGVDGRGDLEAVHAEQPGQAVAQQQQVLDNHRGGQ